MSIRRTSLRMLSRSLVVADAVLRSQIRIAVVAMPMNLVAMEIVMRTAALGISKVEIRTAGNQPAVVFNMGEEHSENYRLSDGLEMAKRFKAADPFDHPLGIHDVDSPTDSYIDAAAINMTAIQTGSPGSRRGLQHAMEHNRIAVEWISRCRERGRRVRSRPGPGGRAGARGPVRPRARA